MARLILLALAALLLSCPARAETVQDVWRGEAIITGQDNLEERARGIRLALTQVLVKVSGDDRIAGHPDLPTILEQAEAHVLQYEYVDRKKGIQISDEQGTRDRSFHFHVDFDRQAVQRTLKSLGAAPWGEDRPRLLVALAVTDARGQFIAGTQDKRGIGQCETLLLEAKRRGLPLVLPQMDSVETLAITYRDVASANGQPLAALATAYQANAVLAGAMVINAEGYWDTDWTLLADDVPVHWRVPVTTFDRAIADGLGRSIRILAGIE